MGVVGLMGGSGGSCVSIGFFGSCESDWLSGSGGPSGLGESCWSG